MPNYKVKKSEAEPTLPRVPNLPEADFYSESLVIQGCRNLQQFLLANEPDPSAFSLAETDKENVLVIRGFDNLSHYLDWFDGISGHTRKV
jgi:hypothetical protein